MAGPRHIATQAGFTLIELVVVIVIVGILAALGGQLIVGPITGYVDLARRTRLVDQAEMVLRRMQRDVRQALPNSIRIKVDGANQYLELLHTTDGGRYRRYQGAAGDDILDFTVADTSFDVLGNLRQVPNVGDSLVVYNFSASGSSGNAYNPVSINRAVIAVGSTVQKINLQAPYQFAGMSPYQRFFVVDEPVTYACEDGELNRYSGYSINVNQEISGLGAGAKVTEGVSGCQFSYDAGAGQRAGLMTLSLKLTEAGETIGLLHEVHVMNAP